MLALPFLKWAGGKRKLAPAIADYMPKVIGTYHEPFLGAGAVFFYLASAQRIKKAVLSDTNPDLINLFQTLQQQPQELITQAEDIALEYNEIREYSEQDGKKFFYDMRANTDTTGVSCAARMLFLNQTCYNGLYRVNKAGHFNVPFGSYERDLKINRGNLEAAHSLLQIAEIYQRPFHELRVRKNDVVYFDPPYIPVAIDSFTKYAKEDFNLTDHKKLAKLFFKLKSKGVLTLLSNSETDKVRELYAEATLLEITANRAISCAASGRKKVKELLIT